MQSEVQTSILTDQPFKILYNFRNQGKQVQKPRRKASACEKHHLVPQFTMRTRKMTAQIQLKNQLDQLDKQHRVNNEEQIVGQSQEAFLKVGEDEEFLLMNEEQLQNCIPISREAQKEILFSLVQNSQISTYSKLQKALIGFGLQQEKMDEQ